MIDVRDNNIVKFAVSFGQIITISLLCLFLPVVGSDDFIDEAMADRYNDSMTKSMSHTP